MAVKTQFMEQYFISLRKNVSLDDFSTGASAASFNNSGTITTAGNKHVTDTAGIYGIAGQTTTKVFSVPVKNFPNFNSGQNIITNRKAIMSSVRTGGNGFEILRGTSAPTTVYEFDVDTHTIIPFLWSTFHSGATEVGVDTAGASAYDFSVMEFNIPRLASGTTPADAEAYATLFKRMSWNSADWHVNSDAVCTNLSFTGNEGDPFSCSAEFNGRFMKTGFDSDSLNSAIVTAFPGHQPLMWHDAKITLEDENDADDAHYIIPATSFSLNVVPQVMVKRYNNRWAMRYIINDWNITGSIQIPWGGIGASVDVVDKNYLLQRLVRDDAPTQINIQPFELFVFWVADSDWDWEVGKAFKTGAGPYTTMDDRVLDFTVLTSFGESATVTHGDGDFGIFMTVSPTDVTVGGEDETMITLNFDCVDQRSATAITNNALSIKAIDALNYSIDDVTGLTNVGAQ